MDDKKEETPKTPEELGFTMGVDPGSPEGDKTVVTLVPEASGIDGEPAPAAVEMIGEIKLPPKKEPEKPKAPPSHQAKVVGIKDVKETTEEEFTSFIVGIQNAETKEYEEYFVPRNTFKLLEALENTVKNKGEAYAKVPVKIFKIVPNQQPDGKVVSLKLQLVDELMDVAIAFVKEFMIATPEIAFNALLRNSEPVFESSDVMFIDVLAYFKSKGCTGTTLMSPHANLTEEDVLRYYNAMIAHADMFKANMAKQGIDIDKKKSIIIPPKGFTPPKGFIPPKGLSGRPRR